MKTTAYQRKIHVYETDLMGIVHHSNYLRFCEEARVDWFERQGFGVNTTDDIFGLVVVETRVQHKSPIRFGERITFEMQLKTQGVRLVIQYRLRNDQQIFALAETVHCRIDQNFKVLRIDKKITQHVENEKWIETWL